MLLNADFKLQWWRANTGCVTFLQRQLSDRNWDNNSNQNAAIPIILYAFRKQAIRCILTSSSSLFSLSCFAVHCIETLLSWSTLSEGNYNNFKTSFGWSASFAGIPCWNIIFPLGAALWLLFFQNCLLKLGGLVLLGISTSDICGSCPSFSFGLQLF